MEPQEKIITDLKIYNPNDFPFGPLSNIASHEMIIDSKRWPTVENYILSNMLITPLYRLSIQIAPIKGKRQNVNIEEKVKQMVARVQTLQRRYVNKEELENIRKIVADDLSIQNMDIRNLYHRYLTQEYINNLRTATEKAYNAKIFENKELEETLLKTENRPIIYISNNEILGIGKDTNGLNFIGKTLMQIRNNIRKKNIVKQQEDEENEIQNKIFDAYNARVLITKLLKERNDLKSYIGKTSPQVIEYYLETHHPENLDTLGLSKNNKNTVMDMYRRGQLPIVQKELEQPGYMIFAARRDKLKDLKEHLEQDKANIILNAYTCHMIRKKYPLMPEEDIQKASEQLSSLAPSAEKYLQLRNKIVEMYFKGEFGQEIKKLITFPKISEDDIKEAEYMAKQKEMEMEDSDNSSKGSDDNPIKQLLHEDDSKTHKFLLIQKLQKYTGKSAKTYKKLSIEQVKDKLHRYEHGVDKPEEIAGKWVVRIKHRNNKVEIIHTTSGIKPSEKEIKEILEKYNKNKDILVLYTQISVKWESTAEPERNVTFADKVFIKYIGNPVEIHSEKSGELSPLFIKTFFVDGLSYPSVAIYNTSILLTHTGISMDMKNKTINKRGIPISKARQMLIKNDSFVTPDEANKIYANIDFETHKNLEEIYARIGLMKKFEDIELSQLLALTGDSKLIYNDQNNIVLGVGTKEKKGLNIVGKILTELRQEVIENPEKYFPNLNIPTEISEIIFSDPFLKSWIQMRLSDMCSLVTKIQTYLLEVGRQPEDITDHMVSFVINLIYKPCSPISALSKDNITPMPEEFINMVKGCELLPEKLSRDYDKELEEIRKEKDEYVNNFYNITTIKENNYKQTLSGERFATLMELFLKTSRSQEQIEKYQESLLQEFELAVTSEKVKESFEEKQREEWLEFLKEILNPKKPYSKIYKYMNNLRLSQQQKINSLNNKQDIETLEKEFRKQREHEWLKLSEPAIDFNDRQKAISDFNKKQIKDRLIHYGIPEKIKKEDISEYQEKIKKITERINRIKGAHKDELKHFQFIIQDISQIFWNYLSVMIQFTVNRLKNPNQRSIREAIVNSELVMSGKNTCENIPVNLSDSQDNCIASALANILSGIQSFKYQYAEDIPFGKHDIDLATGIIIGKEVKYDKLLEEDDVKVDLIHDGDEILGGEDVKGDVDIGEDVDYENEAFRDDLFIDDDVFKEDEEDIGFPDTFEELEKDSFNFAMKKSLTEPTEVKEQVRMILQQIVNKEIPNIDSIVIEFLKAIKQIKSSKLSEKIKLNRINFFATLKV